MDSREKDAILEIVNLIDDDISNEWDYPIVLDQFEAKKDLSETKFGARFVKRLGDLIKGKEDETCILCGKHKADNKIVCEVCMGNLREHAKAQKMSRESVETEDTSDEEIPTDINQLRKILEASDRYTEDLIRNLDASMDRLASRKAVRSSNRLLSAILVISLINTISIIAIAFIVFRQLNMI